MVPGREGRSPRKANQRAKGSDVPGRIQGKEESSDHNAAKGFGPVELTLREGFIPRPAVPLVVGSLAPKVPLVAPTEAADDDENSFDETPNAGSDAAKEWPASFEAHNNEQLVAKLGYGGAATKSVKTAL